MRVIFTQNVKKQGRIGEVKDINEGYARNFLIPQKLAVEATPKALAEKKAREEGQAAGKARHSKEFNETLDKIRDLTLIIKKPANDEGHLFAGVTVKEISSALHKKGINLSEKELDLKSPLKKSGDHEISIRHAEEKLRLKIEKE
jgi:large subunit ribosomal protein L9